MTLAVRLTAIHYTYVIVYLVRRLTAIACVDFAYCRCRLDTRQNISYLPFSRVIDCISKSAIIVVLCYLH